MLIEVLFLKFVEEMILDSGVDCEVGSANGE